MSDVTNDSKNNPEPSENRLLSAMAGEYFGTFVLVFLAWAP